MRCMWVGGPRVCVCVCVCEFGVLGCVWGGWCVSPRSPSPDPKGSGGVWSPPPPQKRTKLRVCVCVQESLVEAM